MSFPENAAEARVGPVAVVIQVQYRDAEGNVIGVQPFEATIFHPHAQNLEAVLEDLLKQINLTLSKGQPE